MPLIALRIALGDQHAVEHFRIGDEVGGLGALLGGVDVGNHDVGLSRGQRRQERRERHRLVGQLEAEAFADGFAEIDVEADILARILRIDGLIARRVRVDGVDEGLALPVRIFVLERGAGRRRRSLRAQGRGCQRAESDRGAERGLAPRQRCTRVPPRLGQYRSLHLQLLRIVMAMAMFQIAEASLGGERTGKLVRGRTKNWMEGVRHLGRQLLKNCS
ncbi:hypothetical protein ACVWXM_008550 [Bradyrhizobium sp. GM7.3]